MRFKELLEGWEDIKKVFHYQGLPYFPKVIHSKLISRHYDDPFIDYFGIEKTRDLIIRKYYYPKLQRDVEAYIKDYDIYLASKAVCYKLYRDLQSLPILIYW